MIGLYTGGRDHQVAANDLPICMHVCACQLSTSSQCAYGAYLALCRDDVERMIDSGVGGVA